MVEFLIEGDINLSGIRSSSGQTVGFPVISVGGTSFPGIAIVGGSLTATIAGTVQANLTGGTLGFVGTISSPVGIGGGTLTSLGTITSPVGGPIMDPSGIVLPAPFVGGLAPATGRWRISGAVAVAGLPTINGLPWTPDSLYSGETVGPGTVVAFSVPVTKGTSYTVANFGSIVGAAIFSS